MNIADHPGRHVGAVLVHHRHMHAVHRRADGSRLLGSEGGHGIRPRLRGATLLGGRHAGQTLERFEEPHGNAVATGQAEAEVTEVAVPEVGAAPAPSRALSIVTSTTPVDPLSSGCSGSTAARRQGAILFTLTAIQFIGLVDFMIVMPLGPQLQADLDIDARKFSWVVSAYTLAAGFAGLLAAPWLDRVPRKSAYLVLTLGIALGTRLGWQAPFFALTALGLTLIGLAAWSLPHVSAHVDGRADGDQLGPLRHFGTVGILAAGATISSLWLAARVRPPPTRSGRPPL